MVQLQTSGEAMFIHRYGALLSTAKFAYGSSMIWHCSGWTLYFLPVQLSLTLEFSFAAQIKCCTGLMLMNTLLQLLRLGHHKDHSTPMTFSSTNTWN